MISWWFGCFGFPGLGCMPSNRHHQPKPPSNQFPSGKPTWLAGNPPFCSMIFPAINLHLVQGFSSRRPNAACMILCLDFVQLVAKKQKFYHRTSSLLVGWLSQHFNNVYLYVYFYYMYVMQVCSTIMYNIYIERERLISVGLPGYPPPNLHCWVKIANVIALSKPKKMNHVYIRNYCLKEQKQTNIRNNWEKTRKHLYPASSTAKSGVQHAGFAGHTNYHGKMYR